MQNISYAESEFSTDEHLASLLLEYATLLALGESAELVTLPGRVAGGPVEAVSVLVGPASQITSWGDDEPFGADVSEAVADLERRIRAMTAVIGESAEPDGPEAIDDFDELA